MRALLISAILIGIGEAVVSAQSSAGTPADQQAIRRLLEECTGAFNEAQAAKIVRLFTPQADVGTAGGRLIQHGDLEDWLTGEFDGPEGPRTIQLSMTAVRFLTPQIAVLDGIWTERSPGPHGRETPPTLMRLVAVVTKKNGRWLFDAFRRFATSQ